MVSLAQRCEDAAFAYMNNSGLPLAGQELWRTVLDAMPLPVFVVDDDMRILGFNEAASKMLVPQNAAVLRRRGGEVLHCVHATESSEGCGHSESCKNCVVRNSVTGAFGGQKVSRQITAMELIIDGAPRTIDLLVTAVPFLHDGQKLVLLTLEDISELAALRGLIPICAKCKRIRDDQDYWQSLEKYCSRHLNLAFTHGLCPECARELFPEAAAALTRKRL